jgi:hypothetical protein
MIHERQWIFIIIHHRFQGNRPLLACSGLIHPEASSVVWQRKARNSEKKSVPASPFQQKVPHGLTRAQIWTSTVKGRWLAAWVIARTSFHLPAKSFPYQTELVKFVNLRVTFVTTISTSNQLRSFANVLFCCVY